MTLEKSTQNTGLPIEKPSSEEKAHWGTMIFHQFRNIALGILLFTCTFTIVRSMDWPLFHDAPLLHYVASEILSGKAPYKDIVDMNMPGTYLLHMIVLKVLGQGDLAWRIVDLICLGFSALGIFLYTRSFGSTPSVMAPLFYIAFHLSQGPIRMGQRDFLMIPFVIFATHYFTRSFEESDPKRSLFWAGMFMGSAIIIKPFSLLLLLLFILFFYGIKPFQFNSKLPNLFCLIIGSSIAPLLAAIWLFSLGSLPSLWTFTIEYLLPFYNVLHKQTLGNLGSTMWKTAFPIIPVLLVLPLLFVNRPFLVNRRLILLILCSVYGALHFIIQGKGWGYHLEPFIFFFITLSTVLVGYLLSTGSVFIKLAGMSALLCTSVLLGGQAFAAGHVKDPFVTKKLNLVSDIVQDLNEIPVTSSDTIQVLDTAEGGIHALLKLGIHLPTRFIYDFHFYHNTNAPFIQDLRREFIEALHSQPPRAIVLLHFHWLPPHNETRVSSFPDLSSFLNEYYSQHVRHHDYTIYSLK